MGQSSLVEGAKRLGQKFEDAVNKVPTTSKKMDTSWHDKQVSEANASFARKDPAKSTGRRKVGGASKERMMAKNAMPKRKASAKRSSGF